MEKGLLIAILSLVFLTFLCSIYTAIIVSKDTKKKDLVKKLSTIMVVIVGVVLILALSVVVTNIDTKSGDNTGSTTTTQTTSTLESAGFKEVTLDEYLELVKGSEKSIVLVARPTCGYCEQFAPILKQAAEDMNLTINYIDTDKLTEDNYETFTNSVSYLKENEWGTPTTLIVQNGDSVDVNSGYVELDTIKEFFTKNGFGE